jgi:hypothetical protein
MDPLKFPMQIPTIPTMAPKKRALEHTDNNSSKELEF